LGFLRNLDFKRVFLPLINLILKRCRATTAPFDFRINCKDSGFENKAVKV